MIVLEAKSMEGFPLKAFVFTFISKEVSRIEHKDMNIHTPLPFPN
jgi:hypothetical protein